MILKKHNNLSILKRFLEKKREIKSQLCKKFIKHCAILIQKHIRGYLVRKNFSSFKEKIRKFHQSLWAAVSGRELYINCKFKN